MISDILKQTKITPIVEEHNFAHGKVFGFRGVRENLGTTSFINHCAVQLSHDGLSVCVLDMDFSTPNDFLSDTNTVSILRRLNNVHESINAVYNRAQDGITYIGANYVNSIMEFLPTRIDASTIESKDANISGIFTLLRSQFDIILVDLTADLRFIESFLAIRNCDEVFTLCLYDRPCLNKLQKDKALCSGVFDTKYMTQIIHVDNLYVVSPDYDKLDKDFKLFTTISTSKALATMLANNNIKVASESRNIKDYEQFIYFHGVLDMVEFLTEEKKTDD